MNGYSKSITPVLLGADLNAYSVALAFFEAYGVKSHVFARYRCGATEFSRFIKTHITAGIDDVERAVPALLKFAAENTGAELFLIPTADWYVEMLEEARNTLSGIYKIHIPEKNMRQRLTDKCSFYSCMREYGIAYPPYVSFGGVDEVTYDVLSGFDYPAVLKPSDSSEYWRNPFPDMKKVYFPKSRKEAKEIANRIFDSGYGGRVILQRLVGGHSGNRVLTTVSDNNGRVVRAVLGDVILEEVGKTSFGNHSAIITVPLDNLSFKLIDFLNEKGYKGIANFDIMTDGGERYVLEMNARQGRSCDYLRAAGVNLGRLLVEIASGKNVKADLSYKTVYWHYPPNKSVMRYADEEGRKRAESLIREGAECNPYENRYEGVVRLAYVGVHNTRHGRRIKRDFKEARK